MGHDLGYVDSCFITVPNDSNINLALNKKELKTECDETSNQSMSYN